MIGVSGEYKKYTIRLIIGFIVAPITPVLLFMLPNLFSERDIWSTSLWIKIGALLGYPVAFLFGLPLYFFLLRKKIVKLPSYILSGSILGAISYAFLPFFYTASVACLSKVPMCGGIFLRAMNDLGELAIPFLPLGIVGGTIAATSFWLITRPDVMMNKKSSEKPQGDDA
jgi:hypothetical protein